MAVTISIPISSLPFALLALLATTSIRAHDYNVLLSGETLGVDDPISNMGNNLVMESDCALVLCNNGRRHYLSDRPSKVGNCTVTLNYHGQFVTHDGNGSTLWTSKLNSDTPLGRYAAVMRGDGQVWIYGPAVSGTPYFRFRFRFPPAPDRKEFPENAHMRTGSGNVLFSGQILSGGQMLQTRGSQLAMRDDCSLTLSTGLLGVIWQSRTGGRGGHCYARLNHRGQLTVMDDRNNVVAVSGPESAEEGDYVLVLQVNGQAVIYGPVVWSSFH